MAIAAHYFQVAQIIVLAVTVSVVNYKGLDMFIIAATDTRCAVMCEGLGPVLIVAIMWCPHTGEFIPAVEALRRILAGAATKIELVNAGVLPLKFCAAEIAGKADPPLARQSSTRIATIFAILKPVLRNVDYCMALLTLKWK